MKYKNVKKLTKSLFVLFICFSLFSFIGIFSSAEIQHDYAPIFYFEREECCYPVDVSYLFGDLPVLNIISILKTIEIEGQIIYYFDNPAGSVDDDGVITDYRNKMSQHGYTVYYNVSSSDGSTVIQYWMFYAFNKGEHNRHEGDWEMVQVVIPSNGDKWVAYSQHYSGQRANWDLVEKQKNHIKVYVARGSHANYLRSYSGKLGIASDIVDDNGKVLSYDDYDLVELSDQLWLDYNFLWGEIDNAEDFLQGRSGPQGPKFRTDMTGTTMWDGTNWGSNLLEASSTFFMIEWFLYHFVTIFVILTLLTILVLLFFIYRRHKKYGLGPRILSMLYIDGFNLKSIGNILCFVGLIIGIIGLFQQWYVVSADVNVEGYMTTGTFDMITIDGINGVQITFPAMTGPTPMGNVFFPFALIILVGFVLMIISAIGIFRSRKLGKKYLYRGLRLVVVIAVLIISIMAMGMIIGDSGVSNNESNYVTDLIKSISNNPFGGDYSFTIAEQNVEGNVSVSWGMGFGAILILLSGFILIFAGLLEIIDNKTFFNPKNFVEKKETNHKSMNKVKETSDKDNEK